MPEDKKVKRGSYGEGTFAQDTHAIARSNEDFGDKFVRFVLNFARKVGDKQDHDGAVHLLGELNVKQGYDIVQDDEQRPMSADPDVPGNAANLPLTDIQKKSVIRAAQGLPGLEDAGEGLEEKDRQIPPTPTGRANPLSDEQGVVAKNDREDDED